MNNTGKILFTILLTLLFGVVGYFGAKMISVNVGEKKKESDISFLRNIKQNSGETVTIPGGISAAPSSASPSRSTSVPAPASTSALVQPSATIDTLPPRITSVSDPFWDKSNNIYSFDVQAEGYAPLSYFLCDSKKKETGDEVKDGHFEVKPTKHGIYYVYVMDARGRKTELHKISKCVIHVQPITKEELERVLITQNTEEAMKFESDNRIASGCKFYFDGRSEEEIAVAPDAPKSCNDIINKINMNTWTSVRVSEVKHDNYGRMISAAISVVY